eukprot:8578468-Alexandrium_andersonii.AAC.1
MYSLGRQGKLEYTNWHGKQPDPMNQQTRAKRPGTHVKGIRTNVPRAGTHATRTGTHLGIPTERPSNKPMDR